MPMTCLRPPARSEFERPHSLKINHEKVKSTPQIWPYGTHIRPARECRCRTVRVIIPTIPSTANNTITVGHPRAAIGKPDLLASVDQGITLFHAGKQVRFGPVVF